MNTTETSIILQMMAAFDQRTIGEADIIAWTSALADILFLDAKLAVISHYRDSRNRATPADLRAIVKTVRGDRLRGKEPPVPPVDYGDTASYIAWERAWTRAICDGFTDVEAQERADVEILGCRRVVDSSARHNIQELVAGVVSSHRDAWQETR